jgi:hypothetical protein
MVIVKEKTKVFKLLLLGRKTHSGVKVSTTRSSTSSSENGDRDSKLCCHSPRVPAVGKQSGLALTSHATFSSIGHAKQNLLE